MSSNFVKRGVFFCAGLSLFTGHFEYLNRPVNEEPTKPGKDIGATKIIGLIYQYDVIL